MTQRLPGTLGFVVVLFLALPLAESYSVAEQPQEGAGRDPKASKEIYVAPCANAKEVAEAIDVWLKDWHNAPSSEAESSAVAALFGNPPASRFFGSFEPPERIKRLLILRQLNYQFWESRRVAAWQFQYMLEDDVGTLIGILRDGLNDPHASVRAQSAMSLGHALEVVGDWQHDKNRKAQWLADGIGFTDQIVDLLITKGLTDSDFDVAHEAYILLTDKVPATRTRLNALERVIDKAHVHKDKRDDIREMHGAWSKSVRGDNADDKSPMD